MVVFFCPQCGDVLITDVPGESDICGDCAYCLRSFNVDYCPALFDDGEFVAGEY
jgi:hypothetical protein